MVISGFDKLSLLNYPGVVSCTIFTNGCNMKCPYCQNGTLAKGKDKSNYTKEDIINYLRKRKGIIDGITISGGEPTINSDLIDFIKDIKKEKVKIKLDTNGTNYNMLKEIIDNNLVDYIAMDIKNIFNKYDVTTNSKVNIDIIKKSINLIKNSNIDHEFRTTIVKEFISANDIKKIIKLVDGSKYYIQNYKYSNNVIDKSLTGFSQEELENINQELKEYKNVTIRDL